MIDGIITIKQFVTLYLIKNPKIKAKGTGKGSGKNPHTNPIRNINGILSIFINGFIGENKINDAHRNPITKLIVKEIGAEKPKLSPNNESTAKSIKKANKPTITGPTFLTIIDVMAKANSTINQLPMKNFNKEAKVPINNSKQAFNTI